MAKDEHLKMEAAAKLASSFFWLSIICTKVSSGKTKVHFQTHNATIQS